MFFGGANSASSLASAASASPWPTKWTTGHDVDNEGPLLGLLEERMSNFARRKLIIASTCNIKGQSTIEREYLASDQRQYHVPCPHCGEAQVLLWGAKTDWGIKWLKNAHRQSPPRDSRLHSIRHSRRRHRRTQKRRHAR